MNPGDEEIAVIDEEDNVIDTATIHEVHTKGLLHRQAHTYLVNSKKQVLLQKRRDNEKWDHSSAGHFAPDESYREGAHREFVEELGFEVPIEEFNNFFDVRLSHEGERKLSDGRIVHSKDNYIGKFFLVEKDIPIDDFRIQESELLEVRYFDEDGLKKLIKTGNLTEPVKLALEKHIIPKLKV